MTVDEAAAVLDRIIHEEIETRGGAYYSTVRARFELEAGDEWITVGAGGRRNFDKRLNDARRKLSPNVTFNARGQVWRPRPSVE